MIDQAHESMTRCARSHAALTVAHVDAEAGFSGGEVQVFLLMEGLRRRGHRCVLIAPPGSRAESEARQRGFEVRAIKMRSDLDLMSVQRLRTTLDALRPDIVHLHTGRATWLGGLAAHFAHRPAISTRRMDRCVKRGWRTRLVYESLVARVAVISGAVNRCLVDGGVDPTRTVLVHDAIDPERVAIHAGRIATRRALGASEEVVVVLAMAALVPRKGLDVLVEALSRLDANGVHLEAWIAGEGCERERLGRRIDELGLRASVHLLGHRADTGDLLAGCDLFALPSRREGLGVAALEAMAAGKAVVASRVGGLAEVVAEGRTGLLVPPEDVGALARAIECLCKDTKYRERLGSAGPSHVADNYSQAHMVEAYERLYDTVLSEMEDARAAQRGVDVRATT